MTEQKRPTVEDVVKRFEGLAAQGDKNAQQVLNLHRSGTPSDIGMQDIADHVGPDGKIDVNKLLILVQQRQTARYLDEAASQMQGRLTNDIQDVLRRIPRLSQD